MMARARKLSSQLELPCIQPPLLSHSVQNPRVSMRTCSAVARTLLSSTYLDQVEGFGFQLADDLAVLLILDIPPRSD